MKKFFALLLSLAMIFALSACGAEKEASAAGEGNEITALLDEGYISSMSTSSEDSWSGIFEKDGSYMLVRAKLPKTSEEVDYSDDAAMREYYASFTEVTVEDMTDRVPSQETLNEYVGKTLGELEEQGFESMGWCERDDKNYTFYYEGAEYSLNVVPVEGTVIESMDDWSQNALRELEIGTVEFAGFSYWMLSQDM